MPCANEDPRVQALRQQAGVLAEKYYRAKEAEAASMRDWNDMMLELLALDRNAPGAKDRIAVLKPLIERTDAQQDGLHRAADEVYSEYTRVHRQLEQLGFGLPVLATPPVHMPGPTFVHPTMRREFGRGPLPQTLAGQQQVSAHGPGAHPRRGPPIERYEVG